MNRNEALQKWMEGFGMPAYPNNAVPYTTEYPWLTYTKGFGESYSATIHLYYHTSSEAIPDAKAEEICSSLKNNGRPCGQVVPYDGGALFINLDEPEWYAAPDEANDNDKHRIININIAELQR